MQDDRFQRTIRAFSFATPFYAYTVELQNRVRLIVRHPESLRIDSTGAAVLVEQDGTSQFFDAESVVRVVSVVIPPNAE